MTKYEVGKPFPKNNPSPGNDYSIAELTAGLFDIICYLQQPTPKEVRNFRKGKLKYGVFEQDFIPFFIVDLEDWNFDANINILKIKKDEDIDRWLNTEANIVNLFLVDSISNVLQVIRTISVRRDLSEHIKDILEEQIGHYHDAKDLESKTVRIVGAMSTYEMIRKTKMHIL